MEDLDFGATIKGFNIGQKVFSRYTLKKILGRGGMGVVWLARDEELERDIALKFLPELVAMDKEAIKDLKRETRRSLELTHSHIIRIYDFIHDARTAAISMEYIDGDTLASLKVDRPTCCFEVADIREWTRQLCDALDYAHGRAQVVHRDLKPANLMIDKQGYLKVADFGIAASTSDSVSRVSAQAGSSGTPLYMSPQQMMGEKAAATDDLYALGATLFELLTGKPPFYAGNVLLQVQNKVPSTLAERRKELEVSGAPIPAEWEQAIAACLAKEAKDRPQSAGELAELFGLAGGMATKTTKSAKNEETEVGRVVPNTPSAAPQTPNPKSKTPFITALATTVILLAGLGWYFGLHVPDQKRAARGPETGQAWMVPELGLVMQPIAAGTFQMGDASSSNSTEKPVTQVRITRDFWLGKTEVTQREWSALMGTNPSNFKGNSLPVERVSWTDAMEFCRELTERERTAGRLPEGYAYTLPTEAQWEYACRSDTTGDYAGNLDSMAWYEKNSGSTTHPVGQKQANAWGLADMHGNVWEWCADWYTDKLPGGSVTDPKGALSGFGRVSRGGSWFFNAAQCRSAGRARDGPDQRNNNLGFRLALSSVR